MDDIFAQIVYTISSWGEQMVMLTRVKLLRMKRSVSEFDATSLVGIGPHLQTILRTNSPTRQTANDFITRLYNAFSSDSAFLSKSTS